MKSTYFGIILGLSLFRFGECAAVNTGLPVGVISWTNRPIKVFRTDMITEAMDHMVQLWGVQEVETWAGKQSFPLSILENPKGKWNGIKGWPAPRESDTWKQSLCHKTTWVGGYPILPQERQPEYPNKSTDPGSYRVLVSGGFKTLDVGSEFHSYFAFCGVPKFQAVRTNTTVEDSYSMCWTTGDDYEATITMEQQAVLI
ncbi:hypothetical protein RhiJN_26376 [Ceratobasidium sp. AG-Ba]|nr:hypothetical protein RhiJN_26376 [Ceratobasidium sp. AG-Ba]